MPTPLLPGRRAAPLALLAGVGTALRAGAEALHHRAFVGRLGLPIAASVLAGALLAGLIWLLWSPVGALFDQPWRLFDDWRRAHQHDAPVRLLLATAWTLWPIWFEVVAGSAIEPLARTAEAAVGGAGMEATATARGDLMLRLQRRARVVTWQLLLLPAAWLIALLPWVGLPLVFVCTAAVAAWVWTELPAVRRGRSHRRHLLDLRRNWALALGYGMGLQVLLLVPIVNLALLAPAAAVGGAVLYFRFEKG